MNARIRTQLILISSLVLFLAGFAWADNTTLQEKLKQELDLKLENVTIAEALEEIGSKAGMTIELSDEAIWELPEGAETHLYIVLEGQLAQGLEKMLDIFFLRYAVGSDTIMVYPRPELEHIMGRPTPETLEILRNIYVNRTRIQGEAKSVESMMPTVINQMAGHEVIVSPFESSRQLARIVGQMAQSSPEGITMSLAPILDEVTESFKQGQSRWVVSEPQFPKQVVQIKIIPQEEFFEAGLNRVVDISYEEVPGLIVLRYLAAMGDFELRFKADDDQAWAHRIISIEALNMTVREALEQVVSALGGKGQMTPDGVYGLQKKEESASDASARAQAEARMRAARARATTVQQRAGQGGSVSVQGRSASASGSTARGGDDYVGKISIPMAGGRYFIEFMLRESDLTDELRQLRAERIQEILKSASTETKKTPAP